MPLDRALPIGMDGVFKYSKCQRQSVSFVGQHRINASASTVLVALWAINPLVNE